MQETSDRRKTIVNGTLTITGLTRLSEETFWDTEKGVLRIGGQRHTAIDAQTLCDHLDTLVGSKVAEVIMHNLEFRLGKLDATRFRNEKPQATLQELVEYLAKTARLSGLGITNVTLLENEKSDPVQIEIANPSVKGSAGAAKAFGFSWWAGVMTTLLDKQMEPHDIFYDREKDVIRCRLVARV